MRRNRINNANNPRVAHHQQQTQDVRSGQADLPGQRNAPADHVEPRPNSRQERRHRQGRSHARHLHDTIRFGIQLAIQEPVQPRRRRGVVWAEAELARLHIHASDDPVGEDSFFESAREEYLLGVRDDVEANMPESIIAMRAVISEIVQRTEAGPGLVPDDARLLMGRGVYAIPAIALVEALPTLCLRRGAGCGLRLFEERHMNSETEQPGRAMRTLFEACVAICNSREPRAMWRHMHTLVPELVKHIDEDSQPEPGPINQLLRHVFCAVHRVRGALLTEVLRRAVGETSDD